MSLECTPRSRFFLRRNYDGDVLFALSGANRQPAALAPGAPGVLLPKFRHVAAREVNLAAELGGKAPLVSTCSDPSTGKAGRASGRPPLDCAKIRKAEQSNARQKKHLYKLNAGMPAEREGKPMGLLAVVSPILRKHSSYWLSNRCASDSFLLMGGGYRGIS